MSLPASFWSSLLSGFEFKFRITFSSSLSHTGKAYMCPLLFLDSSVGHAALPGLSAVGYTARLCEYQDECVRRTPDLTPCSLEPQGALYKLKQGSLAQSKKVLLALAMVGRAGSRWAAWIKV